MRSNTPVTVVHRCEFDQTVDRSHIGDGERRLDFSNVEFGGDEFPSGCRDGVVSNGGDGDAKRDENGDEEIVMNSFEKWCSRGILTVIRWAG